MLSVKHFVFDQKKAPLDLSGAQLLGKLQAYLCSKFVVIRVASIDCYLLGSCSCYTFSSCFGNSEITIKI